MRRLRRTTVAFDGGKKGKDMARVRKTPKTKADPVAGRDLGLTPVKGGLFPSIWVEALLEDAKPSIYSMSVENDGMVFGPTNKTYFTRTLKPRIPSSEMRDLVDALVKERYPAYDPDR